MPTPSLMEPAQHIFAEDLPTANKWYTALLGISPSEEDYGFRYQLGGSSLVLSPSGNRGPLGLSIFSIDDARKRLDQLGLNTGEILGMVHGYDDGETASFQDPSGNLLMLTDQTNLTRKGQ